MSIQNAESRCGNNESGGSPSGLIERGGSLQSYGQNWQPEASGRCVAGFMATEGSSGRF